MWTSEAFEAAVRHHDAQLAAAGLTVWVGSEPTFTDRAAQSPQWLSQALGGDKKQRAQALLVSISRRMPGSLVLRSRGRLYPGEDRPRWCLGLYRRRDGIALWQGPPDPILATPEVEAFFSHDYVGSSGQSERADERGTDAFDELGLALTLLGRTGELTPEILSQTLMPFLCDASGNSHGAEINIEKLWNPIVGERGTLGLVEFRALRMQHSPERATALACLLRAIAGMLARGPADLSLVDWGRELHDRFALPFHLEQDLDAVLQALDTAGLGLGEAIRAVLVRDEFRIVGQVHLPGCTLEVRRALEFWPLVGDSASPEQGGTSRLVDASTTRVELRLRPEAPAASGWRDWHVLAEGVELPMRLERDASGELQVFGLRYRRFVPQRGLHPMLGALDPVRLILRHPDQATDHRVALHEWHPAGAAYDGLPRNLADAGRRRAERLVVERVPRDAGVAAQPPPRGLSAYGFDLRCLP